MKRRIEQLTNGIFEYEVPSMHLSEEVIDVVVKKGELYRGSFQLECEERKKIKGFLYSSNPRVAYEPADFAGFHERVVYEADTAGLEEGDEVKGEFTICSNIGEYRIPYLITIARSTIRTSTDEIENLEAFAALAKKDFQKAYLIFISADFKRMIYERYGKLISLYEGIFGYALSYRSLEEFLVGAGEKEAVDVQMEQERASFSGIGQSSKESIVLTKNTWGFLRLDIRSDADFLKPEREIITTDEFIGSTYHLEYLIDEEKLHAGKNFGRLKIKTPFRTRYFQVEVYKKGTGNTGQSLLVQQKQIAALMEYYIDFRLKKRNINSWIKYSKEALEQYERTGGDHRMLYLFKVQLLFAEDRADEACILLEKFDQSKERINAADILGYYLYLTTFYNKDAEYVDYVEESIQNLFLQNQEEWKLQWILFYLAESYRHHPGEKIEAIRTQFLYGCRSRIMFLEAYQVYERSPMLLKKLDEFELHVLRFICKEELLTEELVMQVSDLAGRRKEFTQELYEILNKCYETYPSRSLLNAICSLLIKAHKAQKEYFRWYEKGVEEDLRLTGLYEYYIEAMDESYDKPLPQIIRMYFSYNNTLGYRKKAAVYANVIRNRQQDPQTYQSYRAAMEKFMVDQLQAGRINRDLSMIYQVFLGKSTLNRRMADCLVKGMFTYEVDCGIPSARQVVVLHQQLKQEQTITLVNGSALIQLYTEDYQIFFTDEEGNRYAASMPYRLHKVMENPEFLEYCRELSPESAGLNLFLCGQADPDHPVNAGNIEHFQNLLNVDEIKDSYKEKVRQEILDFYYLNPQEASLYEFLREADRKQFVKTDKKKLVELLASEGMCREAFDLISMYGTEGIDAIALVRICSRIILDTEYRSDDMLVSFCYECFENGKYDETILGYLLRHYDGPIQSMKELWYAGKEFEMDSFALEEKILILLLYMRKGGERTEEIFESYRRRLGKKLLINAYAIYRCYDYFVKEVLVEEPVFEYARRCYEKKADLDEVCYLALLKHCAENPDRDEKQEGLAQELVEHYVHRGMRFAFFKKFNPSMCRAFGFQDKSFVEYRTNPKALVMIIWHIERSDGQQTKEVTEPMKNVYEGIFVKEITLFYGERFVYCIAEELEGKRVEREMEELHWNDAFSTGYPTSYYLLNRIFENLEQDHLTEAKADIRLYQEQELMVMKLLTLK